MLQTAVMPNTFVATVIFFYYFDGYNIQKNSIYLKQKSFVT